MELFENLLTTAHGTLKKPVAVDHFPQFKGMNWGLVGLTRCISDMQKDIMLVIQVIYPIVSSWYALDIPLLSPDHVLGFIPQIRMFVLLTTHVHCLNPIKCH